MKLPELENFIAGEISRPTVPRGSVLRNPNTREELQAQLSSSREDCERAVSAAHACYEKGDWEGLGPEGRAGFLDAIADELAKPEHQEIISYSDSITTGAVRAVTRKMAALVPLVFRGAAKVARSGVLAKKVPGPRGEVEVFKRPWGPTFLISPWNGPTAIGSHKMASALAAGAPAIFKPSEFAPHSAIVMAHAIHRAGLPRGAFQLLCGNREIGGAIVADPRIRSVSFTGGLVGGRAVARACAGDFKPTQLELGGNNPLVAFADVDIDQVATGIVFGMTMLNAQWCRALGRLIVHRSIKDALLEAVLEKLRTLNLTSSLDERAEMGPMVHEGQFEAIRADIAKLTAQGGRALATTALPDLNGYFVAPTLIDGCDPQHTIDEIFGPVASVHTFETDAQALQLANGTPFGLAGYVYASDVERAFRFARELRTGSVKINGYSLLSLNADAPRAAWGLSGMGEEGHVQSIEFFCGARVVGVSPQDRIHS
jgi:acyl-CoA reductase-like NAD-dependent aldehyde dehydrogenase